MTQRLKKFYLDEVVLPLYKSSQFKNIHQVPKLIKIVVNCGVGEGSDNAKLIESTLQDLSLITGQKAIVTRAKN